MRKSRPKHPRLADRDYEILDHIKRYHLSTREVLHSLFFKESELNAVTKVTSRLIDYGFLNRHELYADKIYFTIGPATAKLYGISVSKCKAVGPQALTEDFAMLQYCCMGAFPRERLLISEITKRLGSLAGKHLQLGKHYVDREGAEDKLAIMRVDHGSDPAHILRRTRQQIETSSAHPILADLIRDQLYMVAIITAEEDKVTQIKDSILRQQWPLTFRVEAVPGLTGLLSAKFQTRKRPEVDF